MVYKVLVIGVIVFVPQDLQLAYVFLVTLLFLVLSNSIQPYKASRDNNFERVHSVCMPCSETNLRGRCISKLALLLFVFSGIVLVLQDLRNRYQADSSNAEPLMIGSPVSASLFLA